jgi:S1-C subfamily serine protease
MHTSRRYLIASVVAAPFVGLLAVACGSAEPGASPSTSTTATPPATALADLPSGSVDLIPDLVEMVDPAIVSVITQSGQGSGVVWDAENGTIVTNNHVVEGSSNVEVALFDGERIPGTVQATDPDTDLAVIDVDQPGLTEVPFASDLPRVGELAIALGNPLGFENSVTAGIVSALHRDLSEGAYVDLIQTDAPISPGNSGGALVNAKGEVIGINSAGIPPTESANSLGFAIPSPTVIATVNQLLAKGEADLSFLGITSGQLTSEQKATLGIEGGVLVDSVSEGSAAAEAGLEPGDVIVELGGHAVGSPAELQSALRAHAPGDQVLVTVVRNGEQVELTATLAERPAGA